MAAERIYHPNVHMINAEHPNVPNPREPKPDVPQTLDIPGIGPRPLIEVRTDFGERHAFVAMLTPEEVRDITAWPSDTVYPWIPEIGDGFRSIEAPDGRDALGAPASDRWTKLCDWLNDLLRDQRHVRYPENQPVADPHDADPPATPDPVVWHRDLRTGAEHVAYAALRHDVRTMKGRTTDRGWSIAWFDNAEEAASIDAEARREASSFRTAREIESQLTSGVEAADLEIPPDWERPVFQPAAVLEYAGFSPAQYHLRNDIDAWSWTSGGGSEESPDGRIDRIPMEYHAALARQRKDGTWDIGSTAFADDRHAGLGLLEGCSIRAPNYKDSAWAQAALEKMGVSVARIADIKTHFEQLIETARQTHADRVRQWTRALTERPAFHHLPLEVQQKIRALDTTLDESAWTGKRIPFREQLPIEWAKAEDLLRHESAGETLTNWGGHFRRMGGTGNADFWVVRPDGTLRDADAITYRKSYKTEGVKQWRIVGPDELAITWSKEHTAADHECSVTKPPVGGYTAAQREAVARIANEIAKEWANRTSMSGKSSPPIGAGWNLAGTPRPAPIPPHPAWKHSAPASEPPPAPPVPSTPADLGGVNFGKFFGGAAAVTGEKKRKK